MELDDPTLDGPWLLIFRGAGIPIVFLFPLAPQRARVSSPSRTAVRQTLDSNFLDDFSGKRSIVSQVQLSGTFGYEPQTGGFFGVEQYGSLHLMELEKAYETYNALPRQLKKTLSARCEYICLPRLYYWRINIKRFEIHIESRDPLLWFYDIHFERLDDYLNPVHVVDRITEIIQGGINSETLLSLVS